MIIELDKAEYRKCRKILHEQGQLEALAVVENINPGRIFVDDGNNPASGLIWLGNNDGFIFFGSEQNESFTSEINGFIDNTIRPEAKKVQLKWFEAMGNHEKWGPVIEAIFEHRKLGSWNQKVYTLHLEDYREQSVPITEFGYEVLQIEEELFTDESIKNIDFLQSKIVEFWPSVEAFFRSGKGYCIIHQNEVVSVCFSGFVADNVHGIHIETVKAHQRKKLAQRIAHRFVKDCLENKIIPYWDCMEMNKPSVAVAESLGFKNVFNYVGYEFPLE
ncbi:GNAT family N-acetyltransferase [Sporosarcina sp. USHLN248]|uniref:GNAT family N-acetyltransferase n=1 Tax=Sporosarcina sp. USHLN248 TaxID=3081300 RepID=UPI003016351D